MSPYLFRMTQKAPKYILLSRVYAPCTNALPILPKPFASLCISSNTHSRQTLTLSDPLTRRKPLEFPNAMAVHKSLLYRSYLESNSITQGISFPKTCCSRTSRSYASESARDLSETMVYLRNHKTGAEIFLVGTAHVSSKSAEEVRQVIRQVQPGTVMVELCSQRAVKMRSQGDDHKEFSLADFLGSFAGAVQQGGLVAGGMAAFYSLFKLLGITPGLEFKVAMEEGERLGSKIVYGDQDVNITMRKLQDVLSKMNLGDLLATAQRNQELHSSALGDLKDFHSFEDYIEQLKTRKQVREFRRVGEMTMPQVVKVMLHERDDYMVRSLLRCEGKVVAVVGLAHLDGMVSRWSEEVEKIT